MLHPTPALLESVYETLRLTQPFKRWRLPHADDLAFSVTSSPHCYGTFCDFNGRAMPRLTISAKLTKTMPMLVATMAHEMVHVQEFHLMSNAYTASPDHGDLFNRLADQVCRVHGFDRKEF